MSTPAPQQLAATTPAAATPGNSSNTLAALDDNVDGSDLASEVGSYTESEISSEDSVNDEEYWEEKRAANAWLARNPGGTRLLYPELFIIKPQGGALVTPPRDPNRPCFLARLPPEIRIRVYEYYFDGQDEATRPKEDEHEPFLDRNGKAIKKIYLSSENVELKFWLSTALLQASRQVRYEAMTVLFDSHVFTVGWLSVLPRFVGFLGKEGCAMVRYLDVWDEMGLQGDDCDTYQDIMMSVSHLSRLWHLRIVLFPTFSRWTDRTRSWFDTGDWTQDGQIKQHAVPKMRQEALETHWPEYELLQTLRAQKFTLAADSLLEKGYVEFDRNHGVYPQLSRLMQSPPAPMEPTSRPAPTSTASILPAFIEDFKASVSRALPPNSDSDGHDPGNSMSPTWQDSDTLANKTIPFYNFFRELLYNDFSFQAPEARLREYDLHNFIIFPTAPKSTGSIMRDCAFCYAVEGHCGYHAVPDQPPFESNSPENDGVEENMETWKRSFEALSYKDMREACRGVTGYLNQHSTPASKAFTIFAIYDHLGWFDSTKGNLLKHLDYAVNVGWIGKRVDKDEVPPWDMLFAALRSHFFPHIHLLR